MNYYKQVAEMFDLKLNEEFILAYTDGNRYNECKYMFTELGLVHSTDYGFEKSSLLHAVLSGSLVVKEIPWKPKKGDEYWRCSSGRGFVSSAIWLDDVIDLCGWKSGNCFRTEEEAKTKGKEIMEKIEKEYIEL